MAANQFAFGESTLLSQYVALPNRDPNLPHDKKIRTPKISDVR